LSEWNEETRAALEEQAQDDERHALYCDEQHDDRGAKYHRERAQIKRLALAEIEWLGGMLHAVCATLAAAKEESRD